MIKYRKPEVEDHGYLAANTHYGPNAGPRGSSSEQVLAWQGGSDVDLPAG